MTRVETIGDATLYLGDCREILPTLPRVDAVVTDPPYGVTDHVWDVVVPATLWMVARCAVVTASEPYATRLIVESPLPFGHDLVWVKNCASNALNAKAMPMRRHERVLVFGDYAFTPRKRRRTTKEMARLNAEQRRVMEFASFDSILDIDCVNSRCGERTAHPSQKPAALMTILVETFTEGVVLDPFMGSGTTGVSCSQNGRQFIGIEREPKYFDIACRRIEAAWKQPRLFEEPKPKPVQVAMEFDR